MRQLGVPSEMLAEHGAVSEAVAEAMATGIRERSGADLGISVTGIAGPTGGSKEKPVGTVHIGLHQSGRTSDQRFRFSGTRGQVQEKTTHMALDMVRRAVLAG